MKCGLLCAILLFAILLSTAGCGSLTKDAKHLMETGNYESAVGLWDQVIAKNPNDAEARFYRNLAQSQLLNEDLVTLKGLIDSRQTLLAFDQLKKFHQKRAEWGLGMNPNSSLYLQQQIERLYLRYLDLQQQSLQKGQVLRSLWLEKQYRPLVDIAPNEDEMKVKADTQALGEKKCATLDLGSKTLPHLRHYAMQFCKKFGKTISSIPKLELSIQEELHSVKVIDLKVPTLNAAETGMLSNLLADQTKKIALYSALGKKSEEITVVGVFSQSTGDKPVAMSHSYQVEVPYTDHELVKRIKSVPYTAQEEHCNVDMTRCWSETVTRYRQEEEKESVAVTKMRSEPKVYEFTGRESTQKMTLDFTLQSFVEKKPVNKIAFAQALEESSTSHDLNLPNIGLIPKKATLTPKEIWLKKQFESLAQQFYDSKVKEWIHRNCTFQSSSKKWAILNHALHCIQQAEGQNLAWVRQVAEDHEGLNPDQIIEVIGPLAP